MKDYFLAHNKNHPYARSVKCHLCEDRIPVGEPFIHIKGVNIHLKHLSRDMIDEIMVEEL